MSNPVKNLPFFLSLNEGMLEVLGGSFVKEGFKIESLALGKTPDHFLQSGEINQPKEAAVMIKSLLDSSQPKKIKTNCCFANLSDEVVFSKFLSLPKIKEKEIAAAAAFKINDFLPLPAEKMYLDWQINKDSHDFLDVNVVAVKREIIDSYLNTLKLINIFPLGFEPESCSLSRLASLASLQTCLTLYINEHKAVFSFSQNSLVLLTTTLNFTVPEKKNEETLAELIRLAKFWKANFHQNKEIKNVFLAGEIQNELVLKQAVKEYFRLEPKKLPLPILAPANIPEITLTKFISLFGLAFLPKLVSLGHKVVTLIPEELKEERSLYGFLSRVKKLLILTSLILSLFIAGYLFTFLSLFFQQEKNQAALSGWEKTVITSKQVQLEKNALNLNKKLLTLDQILKKRQTISQTLEAFVQKIPAGIVISEFTYARQEKTITISGIANSRADILALEKSLSTLGQVTIPLSSFEEVLKPRFNAVIKLK